MKFHIEGLEKQQIKVLKELGQHANQLDFYLGGGTALAVYFGHRISVDFDWFTSRPIGDVLLLAQSLREAKLDFLTEQTAPGTLHGALEGVRVTFLEFHYPLLNPPVRWDAMDCSLASLEDLACMKLSAVAQRGARKDFCDIYALGTKQFSLQEMLDFYRAKFNIQDVSHVLYGLTYFDDAESERMPKMLWKIKWVDIKKTVQSWVKQLGK